MSFGALVLAGAATWAGVGSHPLRVFWRIRPALGKRARPILPIFMLPQLVRLQGSDICGYFRGKRGRMTRPAPLATRLLHLNLYNTVLLTFDSTTP